jgi:hypothetical protein
LQKRGGQTEDAFFRLDRFLSFVNSESLAVLPIQGKSFKVILNVERRSKTRLPQGDIRFPFSEKVWNLFVLTNDSAIDVVNHLVALPHRFLASRLPSSARQ